MAHLQQVQFMWYEHFWQVSVYIYIRMVKKIEFFVPPLYTLPGQMFIRHKLQLY